MLVNKEIALYQQVSNKISLSKVWDLVEMTPHSGQKPIVDDFDNDPSANAFVVCLGRRSGKSASTAIIVVRELLIPYSNTILLTPSYKNSKILFKEVLKYVKQLDLPIAEVNKGAFTITLENGAQFGSFTQSNVSSALGSRCSLLVVDETQSVQGVLDILNQELGPMLLDYGVRDNGTLYAKMVFLGTPRGKNTEYHTLFERAIDPKYSKNWRAYQSPSTCNPLLPKAYLEEQKEILPDLTYRQEILAEWVSTGSGVFYAFDQELNVYDPDELDLSSAHYISGYDWGLSDSTAMISAYITTAGDYYVAEAYMQNMLPTKKHLENFKAQDAKFKSRNIGRYGDPSAAQVMLDLSSTYDYYISKASNKVASGLQCINDLFAPQGFNKKPKLYINKNLYELISQISNVEYKNGSGTTGGSGDLFKPPADKSHHWDLIAALRYCIYTHFRQDAAGTVVVS